MLYNDPKTFREDMLHGYAAAFKNYIIEVPGGVARAAEIPPGKVAVINGGGSGHYPAFCGIIGTGFMDATVVGNIFTSPSAEDVYQVAKNVENGSGIFIVGGNYAGDKINFNLARDRLAEEGIDARTFYITDDIASAPPEEKEKRRGNVGTFTVFKIAGAAAEAGMCFDEIVRVTEKANDRTRTMSVGFRGCSLPGQTQPMFHVPEGKMEVGQGIHGEPGVYEDDLRSASEIAGLLVQRILEEIPQNAGNRLAVILDGLGSTKYEELFVVWASVSRLLTEKGYVLASPLVGEFVTSLDMAGIALSVTFLDEELEELWNAPADTPAFHRGTADRMDAPRRKVFLSEDIQTFEKASDASQKAGQAVRDALERMNKMLIEKELYFAKIDSVAGDGDHGRGMVKGSAYAAKAAADAVRQGAGAGSVLKAAGTAWASKAGGTSGVLWGSALEAAGNCLGDAAQEYTAVMAAEAVKAAADKMQELGGARLGDKTMLDVLLPFSQALTQEASEGKNLKAAWQNAADIAQKAAEHTKDLIPKVGRARPQAARSLGTPDAGAVSMAACIQAVLR